MQQQRTKMYYNQQIPHIVDQIFNQFNLSRTGQLSLNQMINYYNKFNRHNAIPYIFRENLATLMIDLFDQNHDRRISRQEYINYLKKYSYYLKIKSPFYPDLRDRHEQNLKQRIIQIFKRFDTNKSGRLNKYQLLNYYNSLFRQAAIPFTFGVQDIQNILTIYGKGKDGGFDQNEFFHMIVGFKTHPKYINP